MEPSAPTAVFVPNEAYTSPNTTVFQFMATDENNQNSYLNVSNSTTNNGLIGNDSSYWSSNSVHTDDGSITYMELVDRYGSENDKLELASILSSWNMGFFYSFFVGKCVYNLYSFFMYFLLIFTHYVL